MKICFQIKGFQKSNSRGAEKHSGEYNLIGVKVYFVDQIPLQVHDPKYAFSRSSV